MIYVEFQCNSCFIRHKQYVSDVDSLVASHLPNGWIIKDGHVPVCPDDHKRSRDALV